MELFYKIKFAACIFNRMAGFWLLAALVLPSVSRAEMVDRIVAEVNNGIILFSELEQAMGASPTKIVSPEEKKVLLDKLIDEKLTLQQAELLGIKVSEAEVDATIERIKQLNKLSDEALEQTIAAEGRTMEAFRKRLKNQLLQNRLLSQEVKSKIVITDADIKAYYDAHQQDYAGTVKYHLRHILLRFPPKADQDQKEAIYEQVLDLRRRLEQGENFARLARDYSQAATADSGGDLGLYELRLLTPEIRDALKGLEAGQISGIIASDQGYQLFFVEEIQTAGGQSLEDVASAIEEKLYNERIEEKFKLWLTDLRSKAHIRIIEQ